MSHEFVEKKIYCYSTGHRLSNQDEISARSIVLLCQSYEVQSFTDWVISTAEIVDLINNKELLFRRLGEDFIEFLVLNHCTY